MIDNSSELQTNLFNRYKKVEQFKVNLAKSIPLREGIEKFTLKQRKAAIDRKDRAEKLFYRGADLLAKHNPYMQSLANITMSNGYIEGILNKRQYNDTYAEYYDKLYNETGDVANLNTAKAVRGCYTSWFCDSYNLQGVKDVKSISLCHSKFCSNCQSLLQAVRYRKYIPVLNELSKDYDIYHMTLTVSNVPLISGALKSVVGQFMASFKRLIQYFKHQVFAANLDFKKYGYTGAFRSLEIAVNKGTFHPHIHCVLVLKKDLNLEQIHKNKFSFDKSKKKPDRKFSDLEILIQKIWYLIYNNKRVTKNAIDKLKLGYSCILDKCEDERSYKEVFKYVVKLTKDDDNDVVSYKHFKELQLALYKRRGVQAYGCLYNILGEDEEQKEVDNLYKLIIGQLRLVEMPVKTSVNLNSIGFDAVRGNLKIISKSALQRSLNELAAEELDSKGGC